MEVEVDPRETIGRAIWTTGIYDLAVSEVLWRLTRPGDLVIDVGANIGYMTGLLAVRAGATGRVQAFEPHPVVAERLRRNAGHIASRTGVAPVSVHEVALSDVEGTATLVAHHDEASNHGLSYIGTGGEMTIRTERLDDVTGNGVVVGVMKLDVEGHEPAVLAGAAGLLARKGIRHLVYEDHSGPGGEVRRVLTAAGYRTFALGWEMAGPRLGDPDGPPVAKPYEAPSSLATIAPDEVLAAMTRRGWEVFG